MTAEPWVPEPPPEQEATSECETCGATDWQAILYPSAEPGVFLWKCRECGAVYDRDGAKVESLG